MHYDQVTPYVEEANFTFEELMAQAISLYYRLGYYQRHAPAWKIQPILAVCNGYEGMERDAWQLLLEAYAPWTD